ncbi:hypothetical protein HDU93_009925 [Gonapodya sp. JEL0774]|nr:hypothetical protein HDU93_009925 [Gonapodya sp. JEL0774]
MSSPSNLRSLRPQRSLSSPSASAPAAFPSTRSPPTSIRSSRYPTDNVISGPALSVHFDEVSAADLTRVRERARTLYGMYERNQVKVASAMAVPYACVELAAESCNLSLPDTIRKNMPVYSHTHGSYGKTLHNLRLVLIRDERRTAELEREHSEHENTNGASRRSPRTPTTRTTSSTSRTPPLNEVSPSSGPPAAKPTTTGLTDTQIKLVHDLLFQEGAPEPVVTYALRIFGSLDAKRRALPEYPVAVAHACAKVSEVFVPEPAALASKTGVPIAVITSLSERIQNVFSKDLKELKLETSEFLAAEAARRAEAAEETGVPGAGGVSLPVRKQHHVPPGTPSSTVRNKRGHVALSNQDPDIDDTELEPPELTMTPTAGKPAPARRLAQAATTPTPKRPRIEDSDSPSQTAPALSQPARGRRTPRVPQGISLTSPLPKQIRPSTTQQAVGAEERPRANRIWATGLCSILPSSRSAWYAKRYDRWHDWRDTTLLKVKERLDLLEAEKERIEEEEEEQMDDSANAERERIVA